MLRYKTETRPGLVDLYDIWPGNGMKRVNSYNTGVARGVGGRPLRYASAPCKLFICQVAVLFRHNNIFVFIHQVAPVPACWLFKTSATSWPLIFYLESGVRFTCDMGYLRANFSLPRPLCSRVRPNVHDRHQTDRCQTKASLNASTLWEWRHNNNEQPWLSC